jgi:Arc/MetJ family transcription regulator
MPNVVTITRPDVIALIEKAAKKLARGNKTEVVALAMRRLLNEDARRALCSALIAGLSGSARASN